MGIDLRLPNITASTTEGQIAQVRSYLTQLTEQLNFAFNSISNGETMSSYKASQVEASGVSKEEQAKNTFSELKSLIIKSADIVEAYYKEFGVLLESEGKYMAVSDFGTYYEESSKALVDKYDSIEQQHKILQEIVNPLNERVAAIENTGLIKSGVIDTFGEGDEAGQSVIGIEIRQKIVDENDGTVIYNKLARLSSQGLELYTNPDSTEPTAIFQYNKMYIANAEISGSLKLGGYKLDTAKGLTFKWEGR